MEWCVAQPVSLVRVSSMAKKHLDNIRIALNIKSIGSILTLFSHPDIKY